jgi:hypothetical protein
MRSLKATPTVAVCSASCAMRAAQWYGGLPTTQSGGACAVQNSHCLASKWLSAVNFGSISLHRTVHAVSGGSICETASVELPQGSKTLPGTPMTDTPSGSHTPDMCHAGLIPIGQRSVIWTRLQRFWRCGELSLTLAQDYIHAIRA